MSKAEGAVAIMEDAHRKETKTITPSSASSENRNIVSIIERVLMDDTISMDRLERILALQKEQRAEMAREDFNRAMASAQAEMRVVVADKDNSQTSSKYASYAALDQAVRPIYTSHGFSVTFDTDESPKADHIRIVADVSCGAHERRYHLDMPADGKGAKGGDVMTKTHAVMSAVSYGKRGLLVMIFNIPVADKWDDDGNAASAVSKLISKEQAKQLREALAFFGRSETKFCEKVAKVESLEDIRADKFEDALRIIRDAGPVADAGAAKEAATHEVRT